MSRNETAERSAIAYAAVLNSGLIAVRASEVYSYHYKNSAMTKREMFADYQLHNPDSPVQVDSFGPRYRQLVDAGLMIEVGERQCRVSKRLATTWDVTTKVPTEKMVTNNKKSSPKKFGYLRIAHLESQLEQAYLRIKELEGRADPITDTDKDGQLGWRDVLRSCLKQS